MDLGDVGMVEAGENLRLSLEAGQAIRIGSERLWKHLQRDLAVELRVSGLVDLPHPALADEGGDVIVAESGADFNSHELCWDSPTKI